MTLDEIKQLIEFIKGHDLSEFEFEQDGMKVRIKRGPNPQAPIPHMPAAMPVLSAPPVSAPSAGA